MMKILRIIIFAAFIILVAVGIGFVAFAIYHIYETDVCSTNLAIGIGFISLGLALLALWVSMISDERMKAIANLEFDEKASIIEAYRSTSCKSYNKDDFEVFRWNSEAILHVAKWAQKEKRTRAANYIDNIADNISPHVTQDSIVRLKEISSKIRPKNKK